MAGKLPFLSLGSVRAKFLAFISIMHDVTERKQAEQKRAESQEQLQALADNLQVALSSMSDGISILDADLKFVAFNQRYVDLLNFPEGLVREGGSVVDVTEFAAKRGDYGSQFDGDPDGIVAARLKQFKSNEENLIENITPTGRIVEYRSSPIKGGGRVLIMHDITERKRAEEALRKSEQRLKDSIEALADGFALHDADDSLVLYNRRYAELLSPAITDALKPGSQWEANLRAQCAQGLIPAADGRLEAWIAERRSAHLNPKGPIVQERSGNAWIRLNERKAQDDSIVTIVTDITELKRTEQALRESEQRLLAMLRESPVGVGLIKATDNTVAFANARYDSIFGFEKGALIGRTTPELFVDTRDRDALLDDFKKEGSVYDRELRLQRSDGTAFWGLVTLLPFEYEGASARLVWIYDITERKRAEQELAEKDAQFRVALDYMPGGIRVVDEDRKYVFFNARYLELYDFPEGLLKVGEPYRVENLHQAKRGDFGPGDPEALTDKWIVSLTRETELQTWERTTVAGKILEVSTAPTPVGGFVNIVTDITERKRAEEELAEKEAQLRVALDNMPGGIALHDRDLNYVLFNSQYSELFDYPDGLVRVGGSRRDVLRYQAERGDFGPDDKDSVIEQVIATHQRGEAVSRERTIAGSGRTLQIDVAPTPEGGSVSIYTDITDRKRMEEALQEAYGNIKNQRDRMEDELNIGREIQMSMVPLTFPAYPERKEFSIFAALEPAREVGGDFYDFFFIDEVRLCFCVGDVSGKGVPAALFMAVTKTLVKSRAVNDFSPASILTHVNDELGRDNDACMFVTLFLGILDVKTGALTYTNAGHNPPYLLQSDGGVIQLDQRHGLVVAAMEGMVYGEDKITVIPGDLLLMYTDGVTEAMDVNEKLYSDERLTSLMSSRRFESAEEIVDVTVSDVWDYQGDAEQADDVTVLAVQYFGEPEGKALRVLELDIKNHPEEIARMNEAFDSFCDQYSVPAGIHSKMNVVFDELLGNIVSYAYRDEGDHTIEVRVELSSDRLAVTITDDGIPFNPFTRVVPDTTAVSIQEREPGGLGIHLVSNMMDEVSYRRRTNRNVVILVKHL